jgi:hypothetical protein
MEAAHGGCAWRSETSTHRHLSAQDDQDHLPKLVLVNSTRIIRVKLLEQRAHGLVLYISVLIEENAPRVLGQVCYHGHRLLPHYLLMRCLLLSLLKLGVDNLVDAVESQACIRVCHIGVESQARARQAYMCVI